MKYVQQTSTPILLLQGESDDTVAWVEAVGFYNALRFNGKKVILLSYPDEGTGSGNARIVSTSPCACSTSSIIISKAKPLPNG